MDIFVTAIGTDSGKTLVSAVLCEIMGAEYWKPIQAGTPTDTDTLKSLTSSQEVKPWPEAYLLKAPMSPHAAAAGEGITIDLKSIIRPQTNAHLVIEGAGGILVPINDTQFVIDLAVLLGVGVVLVSNLYLGSINHTLLTASELKRRKVNVIGIVFNGPSNPASEQIILAHTGYQHLFSIPQLSLVNPSVVSQLAADLRPSVLPKLLGH